jgi:hypothetical protein
MKAAGFKQITMFIAALTFSSFCMAEIDQANKSVEIDPRVGAITSAILSSGAKLSEDQINELQEVATQAVAAQDGLGLEPTQKPADDNDMVLPEDAALNEKVHTLLICVKAKSAVSSMGQLGVCSDAKGNLSQLGSFGFGLPAGVSVDVVGLLYTGPVQHSYLGRYDGVAAGSASGIASETNKRFPAAIGPDVALYSRLSDGASLLLLGVQTAGQGPGVDLKEGGLILN